MSRLEIAAQIYAALLVNYRTRDAKYDADFEELAGFAIKSAEALMWAERERERLARGE